MRIFLKKIPLLLLGVLSSLVGLSQDILISDGGVVNTCTGTFFDSGGTGGPYQNNENSIITICTDNPDDCIGLNFTFYDIEGGFDLLTFYGGDSQFAPVITTLDGAGNNFSVTSPVSCITIQFTSDFTVNLGGWEASIVCGACPSCDDGIMNGFENGVDCGGDCEPCPCADEMIPQLPFNYSGSTCGMGSSFDFNDACNNFNISGEDMTFSYTATFDGCVGVELSGLNFGGVGLIVTEGCPDDITASCELSLSQFGTPTMSGIFIAEAGVNYFITVGSESFGAACTDFSLDLEEGCPTLSPADCFGAIPVCQNLYEETAAPTGNGSFPMEIGPGSCNFSETNSYWYSFTVQETGLLSFIIEPNNNFDDYDWALYNITEFGCEDIPNTPEMEVSCNSWGALGVNGPTGISTADGGVGNSNGPGDLNGPPFNADLPVQEGETYALVVMNWSNSQVGYNLNFGNSTADIFDQTAPEIVSIEVACSNQEIRVSFSEPVLCSSLIPENLQLIGENGELVIDNVSSQNCSIGAQLSSTALITLDEPLEPGIYTLIGNAEGAVVDPCANPVETNFEFEVFPGFSVDPIINNACAPGEGEIDASDFSGGQAPISFTLNGISNETGLFEALDQGLYTLLVEDAGGCELVLELEVITEELDLDIFGEFNRCELSTTLNAEYSTGSISWEAGENLQITDPNADEITVNAELSGVYIVSATVSTDLCEFSVEQELTLVQPLEIELEPLDGCAEGQGAVELLSVDGGLGVIEYSLNGESNTSGNFDGLDTGSYQMLAEDENGCQVEADFELVVVELSVELGPDQEVCFLEIELSAEFEAENIEWSGPAEISFGSSNEGITSVTASQAGTYVITAEVFSEFCDAVDLIEVSFSEPILFDEEHSDVSCFGFCDGVLNITTIPTELAVSINSGADFSAQTDFFGLCAGVYPIVIVDQQGCIFESQVEITEPPRIEAAFDASPQPTQIPVSFIEFENLSEGFDFVQWDFGFEGAQSFELSPSFEYPSEIGGVYDVNLVVTSVDGCQDSTTRRIIVQDNLNIYVPNAFSPDGDGLNEVFLPQFSARPNIYEIKIFDRWGSLLFESKDPLKPWLGDVDGGDHFVAPGVYVWVIKAGRSEIDSQEYTGHVTVLR